MNDIRKILVTTGWETDQNNALTEIVIPSTVATINAPRKVTFMGQTLNWMPSSTSALQEFEAPNITTYSPGVIFSSNYTKLTTVKLTGFVTYPTTAYNMGAFYLNTYIQNVQLGSSGHPVTSIGNYLFQNCTQSGLTITVYTADGNAISGSPWGATNATIVWEEA